MNDHIETGTAAQQPPPPPPPPPPSSSLLREEIISNEGLVEPINNNDDILTETEILQKEESKEGTLRGFRRISKFLSRTRGGSGIKQRSENVSMISNNAADDLLARSSLASNQSGNNNINSSSSSNDYDDINNSSNSSNNSKQKLSSKLPRISNQFKKLMKFKNNREIKTEEEIIILPNNNNNNKNKNKKIINDKNENNNNNHRNLTSSTSGHDILDDADGSDNAIQTIDILKNVTNKDEEDRLLKSENSIATTDEDSFNKDTSVIDNNPEVIVVGILTTQLGIQAEAQIQVSRQSRDAPRFPFLYPQEEARIESYVTRDTESLATGSEMSGLTEVADENFDQEIQVDDDDDDDVDVNDDDNEERERGGEERSDDAAAADQEYYNAVLRSVIRKQFRHLDDEPPIY